MALTTTTLSAAYTAGQKFITVAAYTAPAGRAKPLVKIDDEIFLIVDTSASPTLGVVPGYMGTLNASHNSQAAAVYGAPADFQTSKGPSFDRASLTSPAYFAGTQEITCTGTTGSNAAAVTAPPGSYLNLTGATGSGVNLPVPLVGMAYTIKNNTAATMRVYCVGGTINGTTGTTAATMTNTGTTGAEVFCSTAGAWQFAGNT